MKKNICLSVLVCGVMLAMSRHSSAEVGYSMRGETQPFRQWDSTFNTSAHDLGEDGYVIKAGSLVLRPHLGLWGGYVDNVYLTKDNTVDDYYMTVSPGIMLLYGNENENYLSLNYEHEITRYNEADTLDYDGDLFSVGINWNLHHLRIHLSDEYSDTLDSNLETSEQTAKLHNIETLTISRFISSKTSVMLEQVYELNDYRGDRYLDYNEWKFGGYGYYRIKPKINALIGVSYGIIDMEDVMVIGDGNYIEFNAGLQGRLTPKTTLYARGGWQNRCFDDDDMKDIDDWVALVGLSSRFSNRTYWGLDLSRGLTPSSTRGGYTILSTAVTPSFRHILAINRLSASVSGSYQIQDYYTPVGEDDREDTYWYITGMLDWHPLQPFTVGIGYTYSRLESNINEFDYEQNLVFARCMLNY